MSTTPKRPLQGTDEISFWSLSREKDDHNVLQWSTGIGFALLGLFANCGASATIHKNVVHLLGNEIENFQLCSSSQWESVCCFTLLAHTCLNEAIVLSVWLKHELARILRPYINLGFDQQVIAKSRVPVTVCMGDMETIKFISQYGRPMYVDLTCKAQLLILLPGGVHCPN